MARQVAAVRMDNVLIFETTGAIDKSAEAGLIEEALQSLGLVDDVIGTGTGTGDDPYMIQASSAAVDAGSNEPIATDIGTIGPVTSDLLGRARDGQIDIGAYEFIESSAVGDWMIFRD